MTNGVDENALLKCNGIPIYNHSAKPGRPLHVQGEKLFLSNIHSMRAIAILFVVAGHAAGTTRWVEGSQSLSITIANLFGNGSVIFVFVSGFLFQHLHRDYVYASYLKKKFANVIVPYLLISAPAVYVSVAYHDAPANYPFLLGHSRAWQAAWFLLKGGAGITYPLWFIPMIALFFLAAPVFSAVIRQPSAYWLIPPLLCISAVIKRPPPPNLDTLHLAVYMLPAYLLGMWCSQCGTPLLHRLNQYSGLTYALIVAFAVLPLLVDTRGGGYTESGYFTFESGWVDWPFVQKIGLSLLLTAVLINVSTQFHKRLAPLADASFAIFFIHAWWLLLIRKTIECFPVSCNIVLWLLISISALGLSYATARLVKTGCPNWSRHLIGY